jgi:hypothetical protein
VHNHIPSAATYKMKNHNQYNGGIADCWYSGKGAGSRDLWIEWKFITVPKRDHTVIDLMGGKKPMISALQQDWLRERLAEGRNVWVGIGSKDGGILLKNCAWEAPTNAGVFRLLLLNRKEIAAKITGFVQGTE